MLEKIITHLIKKPKILFLIDGLGAMLTAFFLFVVLRHLNEYIGMPKTTLVSLSAIAACFSFYSVICFLFLKEKWIPFIRIISIANLLYCILTMGLLFVYYNQLTALGLAYFLVEITIICVLFFIEINVATKIKD